MGMKTEDYFMNSVPQKIANAKGRFSTQFMSGDIKTENLSRKKSLEEGVRMGGYEVNIRKPATSRTDIQQPMARYSEFWIG